MSAAMRTFGRIAATVALFLAMVVLQQVGYWLIRIPHVQFDPAEIVGAIAIGLSWVAAWGAIGVWKRP